MNNIKIFASEKQDGLTDIILNNKISFASSITKLDIEPEVNNIFKSIANNIDQPDLIRRYSILASVGWNNNDDVFFREELFNARDTPVDKQVNFMHNELDIIGHMTESFILDQNRNLITNASFNELPENFDIGVGFVLYKIWENKARADLINKVIAEIDSGNWFVSMECMFPNFDYAVIDKNNNHKVIARNERTAFLSKHLRAYGGNGVYQEYKVGRLLRGLFFSGKGIVDNPANKRSVILNSNFSSTASNLNIREEKMDELEKVKAELVKVQAENAKLVLEASEKAKAAASSEVEKAKAEKIKVESDYQSALAEVEKLKKDVATANENVTKAIAEAKDAKDKEDAMSKECAKLKSEAAKASRISQLTKAGLDDAKAEEVYNKWSSVADEQFADIVSLHSKGMQATQDDDADDGSATAKAKTVVTPDLDKTVAEKKIGNTDTSTEQETQIEKRARLSKSFARFMPLAAAAEQLNK